MNRDLVFAILATSLLLSEGAEAQWVNDPDSNTAIIVASGDQNYPVITSDGTGGAIVAWQDTRDPVTGLDIYVQRIDASGNIRWAPNGFPICQLQAAQEYPAVASDGSGGAFIAWTDARDISTFSIYAQRLDSSGNAHWGAGGQQVSAPIASLPSSPLIGGDHTGGLILMWWQTSSNVLLQRLDPAGTELWEAGGMSPSANPKFQSRAAMVPDGFGGVYVTWNETSSAPWSLRAQHIENSGARLWGPEGVLVVADTVYYKSYPAIVADETGAVIISWVDGRGGVGVSDIYAQRLTASGLPAWSPNGVPLCNATGNQLTPVMAGDGQGGAIIVWNDLRDTPDPYNLYAQCIDSSGVTQWDTVGMPVCKAPNSQSGLAIVKSDSGSIIVVWADRRSNVGDDIYAQHINRQSASLWGTDGVLVCGASGYQNSATVTTDMAGGAIIAWRDSRNASTGLDIYAQSVSRDGTLRGTTGVTTERPVPRFPSLEQNYPNPFNPFTVISYTVAGSKEVGVGSRETKLAVCDLLGREVATLVNERKAPGQYQVTFDASGLASGVYFYRLTAGPYIESRKMVLMK